MGCMYSVGGRFDGMRRVPRISVFSLVCECVCTCVFSFIFFYGGVRCRPGVLKGTRQLPFTAPGGNKQRGRGSYLPLFIRAGGRRGDFIGVTL